VPALYFVRPLYTEREKGGKPYRKPYSIPYGLTNPYRNLKSENSQDYAQKPQRNFTFMNCTNTNSAQFTQNENVLLLLPVKSLSAQVDDFWVFLGANGRARTGKADRGAGSCKCRIRLQGAHERHLEAQVQTKV
jgi:hypothetical protein